MKSDTHLSSNLEDYLEIIYNLSQGEPHVHLVDIAKALDVKKPSVTSALNILKEQKLIVYEKYKPVNLTKKGLELASQIQGRHRVLKNFFIDILGVEAERAEDVACKMEHIVDDDICEKFLEFVENLKTCKHNNLSCNIVKRDLQK